MKNINIDLELPKKFLAELSSPFVSRDEEAKVITLALLSREHVILIGEPGTAKSALARRAAELINAKFFKYLLTKYTEPAELFGPLDINALRNGVYKRITRGKLPEAEIVFLDEIFNANSAILNALLSILNERILYDGYTEIPVPLWTLISASNRIPDEPELEALYDRLLLRHYIKPVEENKWGELLDASWKIETLKIPEAKPMMTMSDLKQLYEVVLNINIEPIKPKLLRLYALFEEKGLHITDRRKGKALKVIAAHAVLNGRDTVHEEDLIVLKYIIPRDLDDFDKVSAILAEELKTPAKYIRELNDIYINIDEISRFVEEATDYDPRLVELLRNLNITKDRVLAMVGETSNTEVKKLADEVLRKLDKTLDLIARKLGF